MEDLFAKFINEEFECVYSDSNVVKWFMECFDNKFTEDEFYENFEEFKGIVVDATANDEWLIEQIHVRMDDMLRNLLEDYLENK